MLQRTLPIATLVIALGLLCASASSAGVPFAPLSTCTITITQFPPRPICMTNWDPDVIRLTPAGSTASPAFDRASVTVRVRDANNAVISNVIVTFSEQSGIVNIANLGSTAAFTNQFGLATVALHGASGYGRVALCADGVQICNLQVRSPDVNKGSTPMLCGLSTGTSVVAGSEIINPVCGWLANFGTVTIGVNDGWDLDCNGQVSGADVTGTLGKGGVLQYFGDSGTLGAVNFCISQ
jgi:hypothetical protein